MKIVQKTMTQIKIPREVVDGLLLLDKPPQLSSNAALQKTKHLFNAKKAGHTGTLDPLATGMLPICFGEATKFSAYLLAADKHYHVTAQLGVKTTTGDAEGEVISERTCTAAMLAQAQDLLASFIGEMDQLPPMYSALKYQGRPLYELARRGEEVVRSTRRIHIYDIAFEDLTSNFLTFTVRCSKGTYVRTLVEDFGEKLGCGAHVTALRRIGVAQFEATQLHTLEGLQGMKNPKETLLPVTHMLGHLPVVNLSESSAFFMRRGQGVVYQGEHPEGSLVQLLGPGGVFMGVGEIKESKVIPHRLIASN